MFAPSDKYALQTSNPEFSYTFVTDGGNEYAINIKSSKEQLFLADLELDGLEVWEFQFFPLGGSLVGNDTKIQATVIDLICTLVVDRHHLVWYICDSSDNKHHIRARLFDSWFHKFSNKRTLKLDGKIRESLTSDEDILVSIIMHQSNPHKDQIYSLFYSTVTKLDFSKNPGSSL